MFFEKVQIPGEHNFTFTGKAGMLEGILTVPDNPQITTVAILGHPHSLYGGTMQNKVVTTMTRAFKEKNIASLRFNFRGVGKSEGAYDGGIGESEDMLALAQLWLRELPQTAIIFAGFSFGSYVAYRAAVQQTNQLLISIAPAVHHYDYQQFTPRPNPWVIIQGDLDEVVPPVKVWEFAKQADPPIQVIRMADATHFFHGKLIPLRLHIEQLIGNLS